MKRISITPVAWIALLWALSFVLTVLSIVLLYQIKFVLNADTYVDFWLELTLAAVVGPGLGWAILYGDPHQSIAWIFCTLGFFAGVHHFCAEYVTYTLLDGESLPSGTVMAGIASWIWVPMFGLFVFLCMLFPFGELLRPTSLWRWLAWSTAIVVLAATILVAFTARYVNGLPSIPNPLALDGVNSLVGVDTVDLVRNLLFVLAFIALSPLFVRWYYAKGKERLQINGFACAASITVIGVVLKFAIFQEWEPKAEGLWWLGSLIAFLGIVAIPTAIVIAVRKYGLYDGINHVINRTLVYTPLTVLLFFLYWFLHVYCVSELIKYIPGTLFGIDLNETDFFSTMIVAAIFEPLRRHLQNFIDYLFLRRKYDTAKILSTFNAKLRDKADLSQLKDDLVAVVKKNMQPAYASVVVFRQNDSNPQAPETSAVETSEIRIEPNDPIVKYPASLSEAVEINKLDLNSPTLRAMKAEGVTLIVPLVNQHKLIGFLKLWPRSDQQHYSTDDRKLLDELATLTTCAMRIAQLVRQQRESDQKLERIDKELRDVLLIKQAYSARSSGKEAARPRACLQTITTA